MRSKSRRYEVLLPVRFNDGKDVPEELLAWIPTAPYELTLNSLAAALQLEFTCIS